jgi:hypothetical protein
MSKTKYPVYVISKGRWQSRLTVKALEKMNVPYHVCVEPQEYEEYAKVIDKDKIYVLPFSNLGKGSIPVRNWVWEHSISIGAKRHWVLDDNIRHFRVVRNGERSAKDAKDVDGSTFRYIEDFVDKYENIKMSGMQYTFHNVYNPKPMILNTRIYSCILLSNDLDLRWRGRYNEDTDLSLRILESGYCTVLFNMFTCDKQRTMTMKGGNTDILYKQDDKFDGRLAMARQLQKAFPDIVKIKWKWGRWQHEVDYRKFRKNKLIRL